MRIHFTLICFKFYYRHQEKSSVVLVLKEFDSPAKQDPYAKWVTVRRRVLALVSLPALLPPVTSTMYLPTINVVRPHRLLYCVVST